MTVRFLNQLTLLFLVFLGLGIRHDVFSQGCSDAGFCSMGAMKPDQPYVDKLDLKLRSISFSQYSGLTRFDDLILAGHIEANFSAFSNYVLQVKVPYQSTIGPLATTGGLSDISLSISRNLVYTDDFQINATLGGKIPTTDGNVSQDGRSLPMYYQPSLGTWDLVAGASFMTKKWLAAVGWQHAFNKNKNGFFWGPWKSVGLFDTAKLYPASINLKRGEDIMWRLERNWRFSKFNFAIGYLHIYRINEDTRDNPKTGEREFVVDDEGTSKGSAISALFTAGYNFSTKSAFKMVVGRRVIKRHFNADGLSREWVFSPTVEFKF